MPKAVGQSSQMLSATMLHMATIGVRELRQNASVYLNRVIEGEVIEVSVRGKTVARIVPVAETAWDRMVAEGLVRPPAEGTNLLDLRPIKSETGILPSEVLRKMREDER